MPEKEVKIKKEEEPPKQIRISIISNYFGKKSSVSSENGDSKSTSDNGKLDISKEINNVSKMMEEFRIEFEDEDLFLDVYGTRRGFSYSGEPMSSSFEELTKKGFSYEGEITMSKLDVSRDSDNKKSFVWF